MPLPFSNRSHAKQITSQTNQNEIETESKTKQKLNRAKVWSSCNSLIKSGYCSSRLYEYVLGLNLRFQYCFAFQVQQTTKTSSKPSLNRPWTCRLKNEPRSWTSSVPAMIICALNLTACSNTLESSRISSTTSPA